MGKAKQRLVKDIVKTFTMYAVAGAGMSFGTIATFKVFRILPPKTEKK